MRRDGSPPFVSCEDALFAESPPLGRPGLTELASRETGTVFPVALAADGAPAVRPDVVRAAGTLVVRFLVDLLVDISPVALRAVEVPTVDLRADDGVAADVRLPAADLPAVDVVLAFLGADAPVLLPMLLRVVLTFDAVVLLPAGRAVDAGRVVPPTRVREPAPVAFAVALPAATFFVAVLPVADFAGPLAVVFLTVAFLDVAFLAGVLLAADFLLAFFAADLDAALVAPVLLVDLRGLVVAMRVSRRRRRRTRPAFDSTAAMHAR